MISDSNEIPSAKMDLLDIFASLWSRDGEIPNVFSFLEAHPETSIQERVRIFLLDQEKRMNLGLPLPVEKYIDAIPDIDSAKSLKIDLVIHEFKLRKLAKSDINGYVDRFPDLGDELRRGLKEHFSPSASEPSPPSSTRSRPIDPMDPFTTSDWGYALGCFGHKTQHFQRLGRYRVEKLLKAGAFGATFLAFDDFLERHVAIKVPHSNLITTPGDIDSFMEEARILAGLDHPGVVTIYDFGNIEDGLCYVVEKFAAGSDLEAKIAVTRFSPSEAAQFLAAASDALHYVHTRGLIHRDIKPANILIDSNGSPILADFGLALRRKDFSKNISKGGTLAYMSPEQIEREWHLVDGRSDIYSMGVVLYQLLTGVLPFTGETRSELMDKVLTIEPCPPRQIDDSIPKELEWICLKAMAKRATERYTTAMDMAEDLRHFQEIGAKKVPEKASSTSVNQKKSLKGRGVVPKGLRSFDALDSDFFLELLPGPWDRSGLPDCVRFWKQRIEDRNPGSAFRVGLIYGPSGSGKSSLVKAGLLPRLPNSISTVFVEATAYGTESRLQKSIGRLIPESHRALPLTEMLIEIRSGNVLSAKQKILIVIDQLEQWLHSRPEMRSEELVRALRQCDGDRIQCLLLVRDDFWLAVSRLTRDLEVRIIEGHNSAAVNLFDQRHAKRVLVMFGQAYESLPKSPRLLTKQQSTFVEEAVSALSRDGLVVPVQLALFAEMVKSKEWSPSTLKRLGGIHGIGELFLEETFGASTAPPTYRLFSSAARRILKALLPEDGTAIKGRIRSHEELQEISGFAGNLRDFEGLLRILDGELHLLAPVDPGAIEEFPAIEGHQKYYQLTHDYLIQPLREWLIRKQKETRKGRAQLLLGERSKSWNLNRQWRQLPSLLEWLGLLLNTGVFHWESHERQMMLAAGKFHLARIGIVLLFAFTILGGKAVWNSWTFSRNIASARQLWGNGPEHWPDACELLGPARRQAPHHPELQAILGDIATKGQFSIRAAAIPDGVTLRFHVEPDPGASRQIGLDFNPGFLPGSTSGWIVNGGELQLTLGHYRVTPEIDGLPRSDLRIPILITQIQYRRDSQGWKRLRRVPPQEISLIQSGMHDSGEQDLSVFFAEHLALDDITLPTSVPEGYCYINGGPFFRSEIDFSKPIQKMGDPHDGVRPQDTVTVFTGNRLVDDRLSNGFLMARNPVMVKDFQDWFNNFGHEYCKWMVDNEKILLERTTLRKVKMFVRKVPLNLQLEFWSSRIPGQIDTAKLNSSDELIDFVFSREREQASTKWANYEVRILDMLAKETRKTTPVGHVDFQLAIAFARTHKPVCCGKFRAWLIVEIEKSSRIEKRLEALRLNLTQHQGESFPYQLLPADLKLEHYDPLANHFETRNLITDYIFYLFYRAFYADQVPGEHILLWARENIDSMNQVLRSKLSELEAGLTRPYQWLFEPSPNDDSQIYQPVLGLYGQWIGSHYERIHLPHFLRWLDLRRAEQATRTEHLTNILSSLETIEESKILKEIPWELRLEYGWSLGLNLPDAWQWEKALRGPDDREYPWGRGLDVTVLGLRDGPEPIERLEYTDVSPHGVQRMIGQVSEWVRPTFGVVTGSFLRGGNYLSTHFFGTLHSNGEHLFKVTEGDSWRWTGIRLIQELTPPQGSR